MNDKTNHFITPLLTKFLSVYSVFILIGFVVSAIIVEAQEKFDVNREMREMNKPLPV